MQSKKMSLAETVTSTCIGLVVSICSNCFIFWYMNIPVTMKENLGMTAFFTGVSIIRGYFVRRLFNKIHLNQTDKADKVELGIGSMSVYELNRKHRAEDGCCEKGTCG